VVLPEQEQALAAHSSDLCSCAREATSHRIWTCSTVVAVVAVSPIVAPLHGSGYFGLPSATLRLPTPELVGFGIRQIKLAASLTSIVEGNSDNGTLAIWDFFATLVTHSNRLLRHGFSPV
jgi:hypothetical protein